MRRDDPPGPSTPRSDPPSDPPSGPRGLGGEDAAGAGRSGRRGEAWGLLLALVAGVAGFLLLRAFGGGC